MKLPDVFYMLRHFVLGHFWVSGVAVTDVTVDPCPQYLVEACGNTPAQAAAARRIKALWNGGPRVPTKAIARAVRPEARACEPAAYIVYGLLAGHVSPEHAIEQIRATTIT